MKIETLSEAERQLPHAKAAHTPAAHAKAQDKEASRIDPDLLKPFAALDDNALWALIHDKSHSETSVVSIEGSGAIITKPLARLLIAIRAL